MATIFGFSARQFSLHLTLDSFPVVPIQPLETLLGLAYHSSYTSSPSESGVVATTSWTPPFGIQMQPTVTQVSAVPESEAPTYLEQLKYYLPTNWKNH